MNGNRLKRDGRCCGVLRWLSLLVAVCSFNPASSQSLPTRSAFTADGLGKGFVAIEGPWQFHLGDDPHWADPYYDDSQWERISPESTWGAQTHPSYTGLAWYRCYLEIRHPADGQFSPALLMPYVDDAYELYWNGKLIGQLGSLPPQAVWYSAQSVFALPGPSSGEGNEEAGLLAIRVWKSPLLSLSPATSGGLNSPPLLGGLKGVIEEKNRIALLAVRENLYLFARVLIFTILGIGGLISWVRDRNRWLFLWFGLFLISRMALRLLFSSQLLPTLPGAWSGGLLQLVVPIHDGALWLLLLWLFDLHSQPRLRRWTWWIIFIDFADNIADAVICFEKAHVARGMQYADSFSALVYTLLQLFPFVLLYRGFRSKLDRPRWLLSVIVALIELLWIVEIASAQGMRFTRWTLSDRLTAPLVHLAGVSFDINSVLDTVLLVALVYAVTSYAAQQRGRQTVMEHELQSAREVQQVLIPEALPEVPGFEVESVYLPAQEVGGDFFQIIPVTDQSTLIAVGDVSGKGLKAAMIVSLIVGTLRTLAEYTASPGVLLAGLNRRLTGRLQDGFATCILLLLSSDGCCKLANAGHLAPFRNSEELNVIGCLPLGITGQAEYEEQVFHLALGDRLTVYTDGIIEARSAKGDLFGFERLQQSLGRYPSAMSVADAAAAFGQDDDITILMIERTPGNAETLASSVQDRASGKA